LTPERDEAAYHLITRPARQKSILGEKEKRATIRRFVKEVQTEGKLEAIDDYFASSFFNHTQPPGLQDREGVRKIHSDLRTAFPDLKVTIIDQATAGNKVWTYKRFTGTHKGEWNGVPATGRKVAFEVIDIITVKKGKLTEHWHVMDALSIYNQIGKTPKA